MTAPITRAIERLRNQDAVCIELWQDGPKGSRVFIDCGPELVALLYAINVDYVNDRPGTDVWRFAHDLARKINGDKP